MAPGLSVESRGELGWICSEGCVIGFPSFAGVLMGCQAARGLQALGEVVGSQERRAVCAQLVVALVVVALDRGVLQGPVRFIRELQPSIQLQRCSVLRRLPEGEGS